MSEGAGCGGDVGRGKRAELGVARWVGEEGLEFCERLQLVRCKLLYRGNGVFES